MVSLRIFIVFLFISSVSFGQGQLNSEKLLALYQNQQYEEAAGYLSSVYTDSTTDAKILSQMGNLQFLAGNMPQAEKSYLRLLKLDPSNLTVLYNLAKISMRRQNTILARDYFEKIIVRDTLNFNVYKMLAELIDSHLEENIRLGYLLKANRMKPGDPDVAISLSEMYSKSEQFELANKVLDVAVAADTINMALLKAKLPVCLKLLKFDEVVSTGEKLLANGDSSTYVLKNAGKSCYYLKQYTKALKMYKAIDDSEQTEVTYYYITLCYKQLKDYKQAIDYARKTLKESISPNVSLYYTLLGALQEDYDQPNTALAMYKKGLQFENHDDIYYNLGLLYDKLKNKKQAAVYYKKFLASDADKTEKAAELKYVKQWLEAQKAAVPKVTTRKTVIK